MSQKKRMAICLVFSMLISIFSNISLTRGETLGIKNVIVYFEDDSSLSINTGIPSIENNATGTMVLDLSSYAGHSITRIDLITNICKADAKPCIVSAQGRRNYNPSTTYMMNAENYAYSINRFDENLIIESTVTLTLKLSYSDTNLPVVTPSASPLNTSDPTSTPVTTPAASVSPTAAPVKLTVDEIEDTAIEGKKIVATMGAIRASEKISVRATTSGRTYKKKPVVKLKWQEISGCTSYVLAKYDNTTGKYKVMEATAYANSFDTSIKRGKTYKYAVFGCVETDETMELGPGITCKIQLSKKLIAPKVTYKIKKGKITFTFRKAEGTKVQTMYRYGNGKWKKITSIYNVKLKKKITRPINARGFQLKLRTKQGSCTSKWVAMKI